jgi:hypothetical protein
MSGCKLNTCSQFYSSSCVLYAGTLVTGSYITLPECKATLTDLGQEIDRLLKELKDSDGVLKTLLTQYNCSFSHITTLINNTVTTKAGTSDTIIAMLRTMCQLQTRIVTLETKDIYEELLPQEIQALLLTKLDCFDDDPCNPSTTTLKELLIKLINKLCP